MTTERLATAADYPTTTRVRAERRARWKNRAATYLANPPKPSRVDYSYTPRGRVASILALVSGFMGSLPQFAREKRAQFRDRDRAMAKARWGSRGDR